MEMAIGTDVGGMYLEFRDLKLLRCLTAVAPSHAATCVTLHNSSGELRNYIELKTDWVQRMLVRPGTIIYETKKNTEAARNTAERFALHSVLIADQMQNSSRAYVHPCTMEPMVAATDFSGYEHDRLGVNCVLD